MKKKQRIVDDFVKETLEGSGMKGDNLVKHLIIWKQFSNEIKLATKKLTIVDQQLIATKFLLFVLQFETICIRAYKPSGSHNTAQDIISMYSSRHLDQRPTLKGKGQKKIKE